MDRWQTLAEVLLEAYGDQVAGLGSPMWFRVFEAPRADDDFRLEACDRPDALFGWRAPADCLAVGMVATGTASALPDGDPRPAQDREASPLWQALASRQRIRIGCILSRCGELAWRVEMPGGQLDTTPPEGGRVLDALRRCFGLPTPPPEVPASELHACAWVASVLECAVRSESRLTWSDCSRLHPLARVLAGDIGSDIGSNMGSSLDEFGELLRVAAAAWSWSEIRSQAAAGELEELADPAVSEWMDDGMFSRWLLDTLPTLDQLLAAAREYLVPSASRRLAHAVHQASASVTAGSRN